MPFINPLFFAVWTQILSLLTAMQRYDYFGTYASDFQKILEMLNTKQNAW